MILKRHGQTIKKGWSYQGKLKALCQLETRSPVQQNRIYLLAQEFDIVPRTCRDFVKISCACCPKTIHKYRSEYDKIRTPSFHCSNCNHNKQCHFSGNVSRGYWKVEYFSAIRRIITVNKSATDKLGIGIQDDMNAIKVMVIEPNSLFDGTDLETGMILESINGIRYSSFQEGKTNLMGAEGQLTITGYK